MAEHGSSSYKKKIYIIFLVCIVVILLLMVGGYWYFFIQGSITFEDAHLESAIRDNIHKSKGRIYAEDVNGIKELQLRDMEITSMSGIEHFTGLSSLDLRGNKIADLSGIGSLLNLRELDLRDNFIEDITELQYLENLRDLNLRNNLIQDISALGSLTNLRVLNLRDNQIQDISALEGLRHLMDINLRFNQVTDVSVLAGLDFLRQRIYLEGNDIYDTTFLKDIYEQVNEVDFEIGVLPPLFSDHGGFYEEPIFLELHTPVQGAQIYYTLDGSEPDPILNGEHTLHYDGPIFIQDRSEEENRLSMIRTAIDTHYTYWRAPEINIFKSTVVKSALYKEAYRSETSTHTFFVDENMSQRYSLPIISLSTNEEDLFGNEQGIYVNRNWLQRGREWEREAHLEFYEPDVVLGFSQKVGIRIHGGWSRNAPQKSLRIYARNEYGRNRIEYDIFDLMKKEAPSYNRLLLRNSGNDFHKTLFRDGLMQQLVAEMRFDTQQFRPAILFINGEYWGIHNIRERYDRRYVENKYGVDRDQVTILENEGLLDDGSEEGILHYEQLMQFVRTHDLSDEQHYAELQQLIDVDSYIDYYVAQIYFANTDWPQNNVRFWRYNGETESGDAPYGHDGRWRWMLFDTDYGFGPSPGLGYAGGSSLDTNMLERIVGEEWYQQLFTALLANESFVEQFILRMYEMLDTSFKEEYVLAKIDELYQIYSIEMDEHIARWSIPPSRETWEEEVQVLRDFAKERPRYVREHMEQFFERSVVERVLRE